MWLSSRPCRRRGCRCVADSLRNGDSPVVALRHRSREANARAHKPRKRDVPPLPLTRFMCYLKYTVSHDSSFIFKRILTFGIMEKVIDYFCREADDNQCSKCKVSSAERKGRIFLSIYYLIILREYENEHKAVILE